MPTNLKISFFSSLVYVRCRTFNFFSMTRPVRSDIVIFAFLWTLGRWQAPRRWSIFCGLGYAPYRTCARIGAFSLTCRFCWKVSRSALNRPCRGRCAVNKLRIRLKNRRSYRALNTLNRYRANSRASPSFSKAMTKSLVVAHSKSNGTNAAGTSLDHSAIRA